MTLAAKGRSWEGITEWEIVSRRGGVRLIFRGGDAVTPMVVPGWDVDALDAALRSATEPDQQVARGSAALKLE